MLRAESAMRGGTSSRAFGWRYGAQGPGVISHAEPGIGRATPERLTARAARVFTRQNAALVLDGPPPPGLRLWLADGERSTPPPAVPAEETIPAAYVDDGGLIVSGVVTRSLGGTVAAEVLQRALRERLRDKAGAAYAPWATYEPVDATHALLLGGSDVLPTLLPELAHSVLHLMEAMRTEPVPATWFGEVVEAREQAINDPYFATALAARAAQLHLAGEPPESHAELAQELRDLTPEAVEASLREFADSLLVGMPGQAAWADQLPMLAVPEVAAQHHGTGYRTVDWPASAERLHIGPERLEISLGKVARTVELADVAGLYVYDDGSRYVIGRDGWGLHVAPGTWRRGDAVVATLDAAVPASLHLPHPAGDVDVPHRLSPARRWWFGFRRLLRSEASLWVWLTLLAALLVVAIVSGSPVLAIGVVIGTSAAVRELIAHRNARRAVPTPH